MWVKAMVMVLIGLALVCALVFGAVYWLLENPALTGPAGPVDQPKADPARIEADVRYLAAIEPSRAFHNVHALNAAADHIEEQLRGAGVQYPD